MNKRNPGDVDADELCTVIGSSDPIDVINFFRERGDTWTEIVTIGFWVANERDDKALLATGAELRRWYLDELAARKADPDRAARQERRRDADRDARQRQLDDKPYQQELGERS